MKFYSHELDNGLTIIGEERPGAQSVAFGYFVRTGARDETKIESGISHFLEHMMFKGTARRSALDITYELGSLGAQANAYTSEESTVYYMALLPEKCSGGFELLSDMMRPALDPEEFSTEKNVILEEIALYQDRPTHVLFESAQQAYFNGHPAGNSVLGTTDSIRAVSVEMMRSYFGRRYSPSNIVLAVAGNFDWDAFVREAEALPGSWPRFEVEREFPTHQPRSHSKQISKEQLHQAHACLLSPAPAAQSDDRYAMRVLSCIIGDSTGSRAYWDIVDKGIADTAVVDFDDMDQTGVCYAYVSTRPDKLDEVVGIMRGILTSAADFPDDALELAKTKLKTRLALQGESSMRRLMAVGNEWLYRQRYRSLSDEIASISAVTRADIQGVLDRYGFDPITELRLLPAHEG